MLVVPYPVYFYSGLATASLHNGHNSSTECLALDASLLLVLLISSNNDSGMGLLYKAILLYQILLLNSKSE
jgi:hypothetical protein